MGLVTALIVITVIVVLFALFGNNATLQGNNATLQGNNNENLSLLMDGGLEPGIISDSVYLNPNRNIGYIQNNRFYDQYSDTLTLYNISPDPSYCSEQDNRVIKIDEITVKASNGTDYGNLCLNPSTFPISLIMVKGCPQTWFYDGSSIYADNAGTRYYLSTDTAVRKDGTFPITLSKTSDRVWKINNLNKSDSVDSINITNIKMGFGSGYIDVYSSGSSNQLVLRG